MKDNLNSVLLEGIVDDDPVFVGGLFPRLGFNIRSIHLCNPGYEETVVYMMAEGSRAEMLRESIHKGMELRAIGRLVRFPYATGVGVLIRHVDINWDKEEEDVHA